MLLLRELVTLALLTVACSAFDLADIAQRFHFPSSNLFINPPRDNDDSGRGRSGMAADAPSLGQTATSSSPARPNGGQQSASGGSNGSGPKAPSNCVYAIVGCCRVGSLRVDEDCFSRFECNGPFWGESPCRRESASMAFQIVKQYMAAKEKEKREEESHGTESAGVESANHPREEEESSPFDPIGPLPSRG